MAPGHDKEHTRPAYEPPRLIRLAVPGDAFAANCTNGSNASNTCTTGNQAQGLVSNGQGCLTGNSAIKGYCTNGSSPAA